MTVLNVKLTNISLLSITLLLLFHFMQMLLILIIVSQWIQKVQSHTLQMATRTFLSLLMPSVILSLQIPLQPLHPTTQSILSSTTGLQILNLPNTWSLIVALNMLTKTAHLCSLFHIKHSPRTPHSPWTYGLVENQDRNLGTHFRFFLLDPLTNWSIQTQIFAYAYNTLPLSTLKLSLYQIVFQTHSHIHLSFDLYLTRNSQQTRTSSYCSTLPAHSRYHSTDLNPFFSTLISKPFSLFGSLP